MVTLEEEEIEKGNRNLKIEKYRIMTIIIMIYT